MTQEQKQTTITKDAANKKLFIVREFDAPLDQVWKAWTESNLLDNWWAPKPWKARTKTMNFTEGGFWLYCMEGPNGEKQWSRADYKTIVPNKSYTAVDCFCDENGNMSNDFPQMSWKNEFSEANGVTKVSIEITFDSEESLNKVVEMGFKEGFTSAHRNLDELLAK